MKTKLPEGIEAIKEKIRLANGHRSLTVNDGLEIDQALNKCCEAHPEGCGHKEECQKWDDDLSNYLPSYRPRPKGQSQRMDTSGSWMQATLHCIQIKEARAIPY